MSWKSCSDGECPSDAVSAGFDSDGALIFVGRVLVGDSYKVAKISPDHECAYYCEDDVEKSFNEYDVLEGEQFQWEPVSGGVLPDNAFSIDDGSGVPVYAARANINGETAVGEVSSDCTYMVAPVSGNAETSDDFQVLVCIE